MENRKSEWVSISEAMRRLAVGRDAITALIREGRLTHRSIPHSKPRVLGHDVEALARASTSPARPA
jgi:hypothetical protein